MKKLTLIALCTVLCVAGCKKEPLPEAVSGSPVFYVSCDVQGVPLKMEAGTDGYQMIPGFYQDSNRVYVLTSQLLNSGCANCYELSVKLNDHMVSPLNGQIHIDSALRRGHYLFNDKTLEPAKYSVKLRPERPEDPTGKYSWTVSCSGVPDKVFNSYESYFHADAMSGYTVTLYYEDAVGCSNSLSRTFVPGSAPAVDMKAQLQAGGDLSYAFTALIQDGQPVSYLWDFGDGTISTEANPVHNFTAGYQVYLTKLTVTFKDGKTTTAHYQVPGTTDPMCLSNFMADITGIPNVMALSKITVELKEPGGRIYSSNDFVQPAVSRFEVVSVEDFRTSESGHPTKRYKAVFNCLLRNGGQEISVTNGEAWLGISYP